MHNKWHIFILYNLGMPTLAYRHEAIHWIFRKYIYTYIHRHCSKNYLVPFGAYLFPSMASPSQANYVLVIADSLYFVDFPPPVCGASICECVGVQTYVHAWGGQSRTLRCYTAVRWSLAGPEACCPFRSSGWLTELWSAWPRFPITRITGKFCHAKVLRWVPRIGTQVLRLEEQALSSMEAPLEPPF